MKIGRAFCLAKKEGGSYFGIFQVKHESDEVQNMVAGPEEIVGTVEQVAKIVNASASGSENVSAAEEEQLATMEEVMASALALSTIAEELQDLVKRFELNA